MGYAILYSFEEKFVLSDPNRVRWGGYTLNSIHGSLCKVMRLALCSNTYRKKDWGVPPVQEEKMKVITTRIPSLISRGVESVLY